MTTLDCVILGVGGVATGVFTREPSSSFVLIADGKPVLLVGAGFGAVTSCLRHAGSLPTNVYLSDNRSDHAAELPVLLGVQSTKQPLRVYAHTQVMDVLLEHRLHELRSTGRPLASFAQFVRLSVGEDTYPLADPPHGRLSIQLLQSRHTEACFGFLLLHDDQPVMGWTADCAFDLDIYRWLACAPVLLVDARKVSSPEHASFQEVDSLMDLPEFQDRIIYIMGYGTQHDAPQLTRIRVPRIGERIRLVPLRDLAEEEQHEDWTYVGAGPLGWGLTDGTQRGVTRIKKPGH